VGKHYLIFTGAHRLVKGPSPKVDGAQHA